MRFLSCSEKIIECLTIESGCILCLGLMAVNACVHEKLCLFILPFPSLLPFLKKKRWTVPLILCIQALSKIVKEMLIDFKYLIISELE